MKNIYYKKSLEQNVNNLTEEDIKIRKGIHPLIKGIIKLSNKKSIIVDKYPKLIKGESYIFTAGHSFPDEIAANLSVIDRHTYVLVGTTDQVINNPKMSVLWLNGMIYVNKLDTESRKDSFKRMVKVLNSNSSVMLFPEGVLNNSENLLCEPVYPGYYHLSVETGKKIVPIVSQTYNDSKIIRVSASDPIDISTMSKKEALIKLRDEISTLRYEIALKEPILSRDSLIGDIHEQYMYDRKKTYMEVKWTKDVWDEEIMYYREKGLVSPKEAIEYIDNVDINVSNASILAPVLVKRYEDKKYNFKQYMHDTFEYNKK